MSSSVVSIFGGAKAPLRVKTDAPPAPYPLLTVTPTEAGSYPVILFLHGFLMQTTYYGQLLQLIASHGYIVVAPQLPNLPLPTAVEVELAAAATDSSNKDIDAAAEVANWLPEGVPTVVPAGVQAIPGKLALAGHSLGGYTAFALAITKKSSTPYFAVLGIDPVAGFGIPPMEFPIPPFILHCDSFDINVPTLVIGSGLGEEWNFPLPPCAPKGLNHVEFYKKCKPPCEHDVVENCGHLDMLDDDGVPDLFRHVCKCGDQSRSQIRTKIAGFVITFLKKYMDDDMANL